MKLFASGFAYRLDEIGLDGYSVDYDEVMKAFYKYRSGYQPVQIGLPEYNDIKRRYEWDIWKFRKAYPNDYTKVVGPCKIVQQSSMLWNVLFESEVQKHGNYHLNLTVSLIKRWAEAHANAVVNKIYGMNLPEIESFITLNSGLMDDIIEHMYSGADYPDGEKLFGVEVAGKERELGRDLTEYEKIEIRCRYFKTNIDDMMRFKQVLLDEIRDEWESFLQTEVSKWESLEHC